MNIRLKNKNAISLIVLVITVIVLAILAGIAIMSVSKTDIIDETEEAVGKTNEQQIEDAKATMLVKGMLGKNPEPQTIGDTILTWVESDEKVTAVGTKNTKKYGVTIPAGFGYVEGTKETGLVIEDKDGNQFVWVPVEYTATGTTDTNGLDTGFTAVFKRGSAEKNSDGIYKMTGDIENLDYDYTEPYASGYSTEAAEYYAMCKSVQRYNGFYIARFEAGDGDVTSERTAVTEAHTVVSKKGAFVYNYVPWGESMTRIAPFTYDDVENVAGAVYLSQNMYKNHESVVSTLCYGVQWDATLNFVSDAEHNIKDSRSWGNHINSTGDAATNSGSSIMNYTTGRSEAWKAKNIYDLAGNVVEVSMEACEDFGRVYRGGSHLAPGNRFPASNRSWDDPDYSNGNIGFRPTLYIVAE